MSIYVSIVTFNHQSFVKGCLESLLAQEGLTPGENVIVRIVDNASTDGTWDVLQDFKDSPGISIHRNQDNLGFCGGQNQNVTAYLESGCENFLMLNPDVVLRKDCLKKMGAAMNTDGSIGLVTPKLLKCNDLLEELSPALIDAAGMCLVPSWRHFDRGSQELAEGRYDKPEYVFSGTGACLLVSKECVEDLLIPRLEREPDLFKVHPELEDNYKARKQLLDEAFFAFREDAELGFRANSLGWRCLYFPEAQALHKRMVLPTNRSEVSQFVNRLGVRNRFLLQILHFKLSQGLLPFFAGIIVRNLIVLLAVLLKETSSFAAVKDVFILFKRATAIRREFKKRAKGRSKFANWFAVKEVSFDEPK